MAASGLGDGSEFILGSWCMMSTEHPDSLATAVFIEKLGSRVLLVLHPRSSWPHYEVTEKSSVATHDFLCCWPRMPSSCWSQAGRKTWKG